MADTPQGAVVSRPLAFANEERRAIHSWSRISSAGHNILLDALKILNPRSRDVTSTEELMTLLQELSEEGHRPTVLRSKDVYAYRSCTTQPLTQDKLKMATKNVSKPTVKRRRRRPQAKKREVHPSWNSNQRINPKIQGNRPSEMLIDRHTIFCRRTPFQTIDLTEMDVQPCLRLKNIEGLSGYHTARLQIQTICDDSEMPSIDFSHLKHPPPLSGIPSQPSQNGGEAPTKAVALFSQKSLSCPIRLDGALIGDSAPVFYPNGRVFPQTHTELTSNGWRGNGQHRDARGARELRNLTTPRNEWNDKRGLRHKVIKVDDSRPVAEARRKAQKILQVNLSPVITIHPLDNVLRDFRFLK